MGDTPYQLHPSNSMDMTSPSVRSIIVSFDLEDTADRVKIDCGKVHPRIAHTMLSFALDVLDRGFDDAAYDDDDDDEDDDD